MKIESFHAAEQKQFYKIVRTDNYCDILGDIITADEETGEYELTVNGENVKGNLGSKGFKIVKRDR